MKKISRQKSSTIIGKSPYTHDDDDVWSDEAELKDDIIEGVLKKFDIIDDDIWAKVLCMEKNKMVGKAYIRTPVLTIDGGYLEFDGEGIGLSGFDNDTRDSETRRVINKVKEGCRIKMDDVGNIIIKSFSKEKIFCKGSDLNTFEVAIGNPRILFDMGKFQQIMNEELKKDTPDWNWVRLHSITSISFVESKNTSLKQPVWLMVVNIVALDLLRTKAVSRSSYGEKYILSLETENVDNKLETERETAVKEKVPQEKKQKDTDYQMFGHPGSWHHVEFSSGKEALI